jgi:hypothetical protein
MVKFIILALISAVLPYGITLRQRSLCGECTDPSTCEECELLQAW